MNEELQEITREAQEQLMKWKQLQELWDNLADALRDIRR